ncbi:MAG: rhodanese-like domain-containing protein [Candidatus Hodarchaeota archaeon]
MDYYFTQLNPHSCKTYLFGPKRGGEVVIIDPVLDHLNDYLKFLESKNLRLTHIFETHTHADHISGASSIRDHTDAELIMQQKAPSKCVTIRMKEDDMFNIGNIPIEVLETPGHTEDSVTLLLPNRILTGDALFLDEGGAGRDDLPGGDPGAHWESLQKLIRLPDHLIVYPAHDYRNREPSSLKQQKISNPYLKPRSKEDFINYINDLKLGPADWMKDVLKANYACARDPKSAWIPIDAPACEVKGTLQVGVNERDFATISPKELQQRLISSKKPFLLDVREPHELQSELGYIKGARNIPITNLIQDIKELSSVKNQEIILICRSGGRATTASQILKQMGFKKPIVLEGGMIRWRKETSVAKTEREAND